MKKKKSYLRKLGVIPLIGFVIFVVICIAVIMLGSSFVTMLNDIL